MKQIDGQISIFDWNPKLKTEPNVGESVEECGAVIPHIMVSSYIGKKVLLNTSTESHTWFKVCILEKIIPYSYFRREGTEYVETPTVRYILFNGGRQRSLVTFIPGDEHCVLRECLPWDAYERRKR